MVASSTGIGGSGSDRQCMADHMTKLLGDSVLILVLPFVWLFFSILWALFGGAFVGSSANFRRAHDPPAFCSC